jgi:hypothetical protein
MVSPADRPDGERAFRLLDPIRRFAAARLTDPSEALSGLERYVLGVLRAASARHGSQAEDLRRLDSEQLNLQVLLEWAARTGRPPNPLLRAIGDVWVWLLVRGHLRRTSELWQHILSLPPNEFASESDRMARSWLRACGLVNDGNFAQTVAMLDEALPDFRRLEGPSHTSLMLMGRGIARHYTAHSPARADLEEAAAMARDAGDPVVLGYILSHYGAFVGIDGDPVRARALHEEMLRIAGSLSDENLRAEAHYDLAMDAIAGADPAAAGPHLAAAVRSYREMDHLDGLARCLGAFSGLALKRGHAHLSARLAGAAAAARDRIGLTPWPAVTEAEERTIERAQALLPSGEFADQVASGRRLTIEDALNQALLALCGGHRPPPADACPAPGSHGRRARPGVTHEPAGRGSLS